MIEKISFAILVLFGVLGALFLATVLHEFFHYSDLGDTVNPEEICLFNLDLTEKTPLDSLFKTISGHYAFTLNQNKTDEYLEIQKTTETKAYTISILIMLLFFVCYIIVFWNRFSKSDKIIQLKEKVEVLKIKDEIEKEMPGMPSESSELAQV